ncbi:hypothetical protein C8R46DRAFT_1216815 [Mycena filopes]|nr:hypothetical protein C8R46DRAFT_1216815 [Mycena filopes]
MKCAPDLDGMARVSQLTTGMTATRGGLKVHPRWSGPDLLTHQSSSSFSLTMKDDKASSHPASRYMHAASSAEKERLSTQYAMKKACYGWSSPVPDTIDLSKVENVLDIAAGTCAWALDFAAMPQVKANRANMHLLACDINTAFFPDPRLMHEMGITTFWQDVTQPFPEEFHGKFDLVHVAYLVLCLTEEGWLSALDNYRQILKRGGVLLIDDSDGILFTEAQPPPPADDAGGDELYQRMHGSTWLHKSTAVTIGYLEQSGFVVGLTFRLRAMLERAGFEVEDTQRSICAIGKLCRSQKGLDGGSLAAYEEFSLRNVQSFIPYFAAATFEKKALEVPPGNPVTDRKDMDAIVEEIRTGVLRDGAMLLWSYFVARKV